MDRVILHSDANSFYASVECLYRPEIRDKPVAVTGDPEARHGIILTKNQHAKKYGVQTGETINEARKKCPALITIPPDYPLYMRFSKRMREIYADYSDCVEPYGLDEAWLDISAQKRTLLDGEKIANEIRLRIIEELGITASIGVADNKVFAKLGSDLKKPDATSVISPDNYKETAWRLPVSDLLFVGHQTAKKLKSNEILTIGELANAEPSLLQYKFGKNGAMLRAFARGEDRSPVMPCDATMPIKSIGNSTTPPHDIRTLDDARCIYYILAESVAARLRAHGFRSRCISISIRTVDLLWQQCQLTIKYPTALTDEIAETAMGLFMERYKHLLPLRSVGLHCGSLVPDSAPMQTDLFTDHEKRLRMENLEREIDWLRNRYGHNVVKRGVTLSDLQYAKVNPRDDHIQPAAPFYAG